MSGIEEPAVAGASGHSVQKRRDRRAAQVRWTVGIAITLVFHAGLIVLLQVNLRGTPRIDRVNPRLVWLGDTTINEEGTWRGQVMNIFNDAALFVPTRLNYASARRGMQETGPPGEIFRSYPPVMVVPPDPAAMGLFSADLQVVDPATAVQGFRWPYFEQFQRDDSAARTIEQRLARIEVRSVATSELAFAMSLPLDAAIPDQASWPDWDPFELFVTLSATGRMSEPIAVGRGSRSDVVDQFMLDYIRNRLRLDLRLAPGYYRIVIGP